MPVLLQVDFPFQGPFGAAAAQAMRELAESIAREPGLLWKIWTENEAEQTAGGVYLFEDEASARAYLAMHSARLQGFGVQGLRARVFDVNGALSQIDRAPLPAA